MAQAELVELFDGLLARGEREEESPDYELLEAAVDGTLDPVEAELFASRLVGDPHLQREFDALAALRDGLHRSPAVRKPRARVAAGRRWLGLAAAAALVAALGLELRLDLRRTDSAAASVAQVAQRSKAAQSGSRVIFAESFETGSIAHWSN